MVIVENFLKQLGLFALGFIFVMDFLKKWYIFSFFEIFYVIYVIFLVFVIYKFFAGLRKMCGKFEGKFEMDEKEMEK